MADVTTETIGTLLEPKVRRDAVHIALAPVEAIERLAPGQPIGLIEGDKAGVVKTPIGIVDPFLGVPVFPGDRFWLFLYPMTITSLRHEWTHPAFADQSEAAAPRTPKEASEAWLREFVRNADCPAYETVLGAAIQQSTQEFDVEYLHFSGVDAHGYIPPEFWDHVAIVTGIDVPAKKRAAYFSCSC